ncbi:hypothetical protein PDO_5297, partial [Rhizobium sp. PDO1-076]|uniref:OST-HTH/LOTUS domain-containing protein n=1 Tax=Rhizobium sp. PDO1-076 TaxID=1125979 RepID=UPI00024E30C0
VLGAPVEEPAAIAKPARKTANAKSVPAASLPATVEPQKAAPAQSGAASGKLDRAALQMLEKAVTASADEDGRANLARVGTHLAKQSPDFDARNYGFSRLSDLAEASGILDVGRTGGNPKIVVVSLKAGKNKL